MRISRYSEENGIELIHVAVENQRANPVERRVQEFKKVMKTVAKNDRETNWDLVIPDALYCLRSRRNAATGESPSKVLLGYKLPQKDLVESSLYSPPTSHQPTLKPIHPGTTAEVRQEIRPTR